MSVTHASGVLTDCKPCTKVPGCRTLIAVRKTKKGASVCLEANPANGSFDPFLEYYFITVEGRAHRTTEPDHFATSTLYICHTSRPDHRQLARNGWHDPGVANLEEYYLTKHWQDFRRKMLMEYRLCEAECGRPSATVHHVHYRTLWRESKNDVLVLCNPCHVIQERATNG